MSAEEHSRDPAQPAAQPPGEQGPRTGWRGSRRLAVFAGVITVGLLAGAGVAFAATGSPARPASAAAAATPSPSSPWGKAALPRRLPFRTGPSGGPGPFGIAGPLGLGGPFSAIHGQYVAPKPGGGYQTIDFQNGSVTAVSSTSITLRSPDGYTHSYPVTSSTTVNAQRGGISSVKAGNEVSVQATVEGSTVTAARITDLSLLQQGFQHFFGGWPGKNTKNTSP
jgi:hypothetical protein